MTTTNTVKKNHCFNRKPFAKSYPGQNGLKSVIVAPAYGPAKEVICPNMEEIPNVFEDKCHYSESAEGQKDCGCVGCSRRHTIA